jgi:hypothetical protein
MDETVLNVRLKTSSANTERLRTKLFRATSRESKPHKWNRTFRNEILNLENLNFRLTTNQDLDQTTNNFIFLKTKRKPTEQHKNKNKNRKQEQSSATKEQRQQCRLPKIPPTVQRGGGAPKPQKAPNRTLSSEIYIPK